MVVQLFWMCASPWVHAVDLRLQEDTQKTGLIPSVEYVSGNAFPGAVLVPVSLLGAVARSGVHHVPKNSDLLSLISYSGGVIQSSDLRDVTIKRQSGEREKIISVNLELILKTPNLRSPTLEPGDVIMIPVRTPVIDSDVTSVISLTTSVVGMVLSAFALKAVLNK